MGSMVPDALGLHIGTFLIWTGGVALVTWIICRCCLSTKLGAVDDYFAGGRSFPWYVISGSLLLTNLSTEQLVGLNGVVFADGCLAASAWETFASLAMCICATVFLPKYMQMGLITTSAYLGERFDRATRTLVSVAFLCFYAIFLCPSVLYTAALAIRKILGVDGLPLWYISLSIGVLGSIYAIFGGLKGVAVSDCLNGLGLAIVGLWVPIAALQQIGGVTVIFEEPQLLMPLVTTSQVYDQSTNTRSPGEPTLPWHVLLTGFLPINVFYWSMNQVIVQRALAASSLAEGQKGVLFAACVKVVGWITLCLPGVIGMIMMKREVHVNGKAFTVDMPDQVYPELVKAVMPTWSFGFLAAVLLGSALSTYNSALNSASTLFALEVYRPFFNPGASDERTVRAAAYFGAVLAIPSWIVAPQFEQIISIFDFIRRVKTLVSLPVMTVFLVGVCSARPDAFAAKVGFAVGAAAYGCGLAIPWNVHFLDLFMGCLVIALLAVGLVTWVPSLRTCCCQPPCRQPPAPPKLVPLVSTARWPWARTLAAAVAVLVTVLTASLQTGSLELFLVFWVAWAATACALATLTTADVTDAPAGKAWADPGQLGAPPPAVLGAAGPWGRFEAERPPEAPRWEAA